MGTIRKHRPHQYLEGLSVLDQTEYRRWWLNVNRRGYEKGVSENMLCFPWYLDWAIGIVGFHGTYQNTDTSWILSSVLDPNGILHEDTAVFLPSAIVSFLESDARHATRKRKYDVPVGVKIRIQRNGNAYTSEIQDSVEGKSRYLGIFKSAADARQAYVDAKNEIAVKLANHYEGKIDPRMVDYLNEYQYGP